MIETLRYKRDTTLERLRDLERQQREIAVDIERHIGRLGTLNELLQEQEAQDSPPETIDVEA